MRSATANTISIGGLLKGAYNFWVIGQTKIIITAKIVQLLAIKFYYS